MRRSEREGDWFSTVRGEGTFAVRESSVSGAGTFVGESRETNERLRERTRKAVIVIIRSNIERDASALKMQSLQPRFIVAVVRNEEPNKAPEPTLGAALVFGNSSVFDLVAGVAHL